MIIELPFTYDATLVPPRARNARDVYVADTLPLNIRVLSDQEFPVAARYADLTMEVKHLGPYDLRWDGRGFYQPCVESWGDYSAVSASELEARIQHHERHNPFRDLQKFHDPQYANRPVVRHAELAGRVEKENRRERIAELVERARGVVVCNGQVWEACGEPGYRIGDWDRAYAELITAKGVAEQAPHLYRADRLQDYCDLYLGGKRPTHIFGHLDILLPEALRLAPEDQHLRLAVQGAVGDLGRDLSRATREEFGRYADLRDAMAAAPTGPITDDIATAARAILDAPVTHSEIPRRLGVAYERWRRALVRDLDVNLNPALDGLAALR